MIRMQEILRFVYLFRGRGRRYEKQILLQEQKKEG